MVKSGMGSLTLLRDTRTSFLSLALSSTLSSDELARALMRKKMARPVGTISAALSSMMPSHLPSHTCQRAIGLTATICITLSSISRASVPHPIQSEAMPSSAGVEPRV